MLLRVFTNIRWNLRFVCVAECTCINQSINLEHALGSTFHLLRYVQRSMPRESSISASLIIQLPVGLGAQSTNRGICRTSQNQVAGKSHPPALLFFFQAGALKTPSHCNWIHEYFEQHVGTRIHHNLQNIVCMPLLKFCFCIFMPRSSSHVLKCQSSPNDTKDKSLRVLGAGHVA